MNQVRALVPIPIIRNYNTGFFPSVKGKRKVMAADATPMDEFAALEVVVKVDYSVPNKKPLVGSGVHYLDLDLAFGPALTLLRFFLRVLFFKPIPSAHVDPESPLARCCARSLRLDDGKHFFLAIYIFRDSISQFLQVSLLKPSNLALAAGAFPSGSLKPSLSAAFLG